jgi:PAS domain S-box-containing protein
MSVIVGRARNLDLDTVLHSDGLTQLLEVLDDTQRCLLRRRLAHEIAYADTVGTGVDFYHTIFLGTIPRICRIQLCPLPGGSVSAVIGDIEPFDTQKAFGEVGSAFLATTRDVVVLTTADPVGEAGQRLIVYTNDRYSEMTGFTPDEVIGRSPSLLQGARTETEATARMRRSLARWEQFVERVTNYRRDGSSFVVELNVCPVADSSGWYTCWLAIQRDATAEHSQRQRAVHLAKLQAVGELASGIAHEINTPAQYVRDNLEFVAGSVAELCAAAGSGARPDPAPTGAADYAFLASEIPAACRDAIDGVERIGRIVAAMRNFSHPGAAEMEHCDAAKLIEDALTVSRGSWKDVAEATLTLEDGLPPLWCHPQGILQCVVNLVVNAAHAIRERGDRAAAGSIEIRVRSAPGDGTAIEVADDGAGIAPSLQPHLFEPFFTTRPAGAGTGQGLALVRQIVEEHHRGRVTFSSTAGEGSVFTITLPAAPAPDATVRGST